MGMDSVGRRLLRNSGSEISDDEVQAAADRLQDLRAAPDGMRAALALYAIRKLSTLCNLCRAAHLRVAFLTFFIVCLWPTLLVVPSPLSEGGTRTTILSSLQMMVGDTRSPLMLAIRDMPFAQNATELAAPLPSPTHIWLFAFLSAREGTSHSNRVSTA